LYLVPTAACASVLPYDLYVYILALYVHYLYRLYLLKFALVVFILPGVFTKHCFLGKSTGSVVPQKKRWYIYIYIYYIFICVENCILRKGNRELHLCTNAPNSFFTLYSSSIRFAFAFCSLSFHFLFVFFNKLCISMHNYAICDRTENVNSNYLYSIFFTFHF
jgi:hypothetical protein